MKTKMSKKVLSAFLAALMVVSVMPFSAFAATDSDLTSLKSAITAYETKISNCTKVQTNMKAAYDAYITACEYADAYKYGNGTSLDLAGATANLTSATNNMTDWVSYKSNAKPQWSTSATDVASDCYSNVVYTSSDLSVNDNDSYKDIDYVKFKFFANTNAVLIYDGVNEVSYPVLVESQWAKSIWSSTKKNINAVYPTDTSFSLKANWKGYQEGNWPNYPSVSDCTDDEFGYAADHTRATNSTQDNNNTSRFWINKMVYNGTGNTSSYYESSSQTSVLFSSGSKTGTSTVPNTVYVINYAPLATAISGTINIVQNVTNYITDSADMSTFLGTLDAATSFNATSYDYSNVANGVTACAGAISSGISNLASQKANLTAGKGDYATLRTAMDTAMATYKLGNGSNTYTSDSWSAFETAYTTAQSLMGALPTNGYAGTYNGTAINTIAANLNTAYNNLATIITLADTTAILANIEKANTVLKYKTYLTADTASAIQTAFDQAATGFTNNDYTLPTIYTEAQQASLDALNNQLEAALSNIVMDTSELETKLAVAKNIDQTEVLDTAALVKAINDAQEALDTINNTTLTADNINDIGTGYIDAIDAIETAIEYASHGYEEQVDGVIKTGTNDEKSVSYANGVNSLTYNYPTGIVIVKTQTDATTYNIGNYVFSAKNTPNSGSGYTQMVYEIGITSSATAPAAGTFTNGRFKLAGFDGKGIFTKDGDETVQGGLYCDGVAQPASYSAGLADGNDATYLWYKNGSFSITSPMTFTADKLAYGLTPTTSTFSNAYSYVKAYGKYYSGTSSHTETYNTATATPTDVTIIDISPLLYYLNNYCPTYVNNNSSKDDKYYTTATYESFATAMSAAKLLCNNGSINTYDTPQDYGKAVASAYSALKLAINGLKVANYTATFSYKTATGADTTSTVSGEYGTAIADSSIPTPQDYVSGNYRYTFSGWNKAIEQVNGVNAITGDVTYTAMYNQQLNLADFSKLDIAVNDLIARADKTYSVKTLNAINTYIDSLSYFNYDEDARLATFSDKQTAIDAETSAVRVYISTLVTIDTSAADSQIEKAKAENDSDAVNLGALQDAYATVNVHGRDVIGVNFDTAEALDAAIAASIESLSPKVYSVTLNGTTVGSFEYGTLISVMGDGTYVTGTTTAASTSTDKYAWYYSFTSTQVTTSPIAKYMLTSDSMGFVVKGNTELTTTKIAGDSSTSYAVTFKDSFGKIIDMRYTDSQGKFTMPEQPVYAFYTANGWSNSVASGAQATATSDTTIVANYSVKTTVPTYSVTVYDVAGEIASDSETSTEYNAATLEYNDEVTVTDSDAEIWVKYSPEVYPELKDYAYVSADEFNPEDIVTIAGNADAYAEAGIDPREGYEVIGYGDTLTFNVCEDVEIMAFTLEDFQTDYIPYAIDVCDSFGSNTYDKFTGNLKDPNATIDRNKYYKFTDYFYSITNLNDDMAVSIIKEGIIKSDTKFSMIAQFAVPENATVVESGILFTAASGKTLTLGNASADSTIKRLKSSQHTGSSTQYGQYVISIISKNLHGDYDFSYRSYCTYKLNGEVKTVYSDKTITESVNF